MFRKIHSSAQGSLVLLGCRVDTSIIPPRQREKVAASADNALPPRALFRKEKALRLPDITNMAESPQSMAIVKNTWEVNPAECGHSNFRT